MPRECCPQCTVRVTSCVEEIFHITCRQAADKQTKSSVFKSDYSRPPQSLRSNLTTRSPLTDRSVSMKSLPLVSPSRQMHAPAGPRCALTLTTSWPSAKYSRCVGALTRSLVWKRPQQAAARAYIKRSRPPAGCASLPDGRPCCMRCGGNAQWLRDRGGACVSLSGAVGPVSEAGYVNHVCTFRGELQHPSRQGQ